MSLSAGKLTVTSQLATHCAPAASDSAAARIRFGNISPSSTQTTGPHDMPKATTNRLAATSATRRRRAAEDGGVQIGCAVDHAGGAEDQRHGARVIVMPIEPMISSGLRPILSMVAIAISVVRMLIVAEMTVMTNDWSSVNPTASQRMFE